MDTVELDTHLFFRESYETRDALVDRYQLKLIQPGIPTIAEQHRAEGANLWERDPDRRCHIRKVESPRKRARPVRRAWISGSAATSRRAARRRRRSSGRSGTRSSRSIRWRTGTRSGVWSYIEANEIPYNPLHDAGYRSIGCIPCTRPTRMDEEERHQAAGPARTSSSAAFTPIRRWKGHDDNDSLVFAGKPWFPPRAPFSWRRGEPGGSPRSSPRHERGRS